MADDQVDAVVAVVRSVVEEPALLGVSLTGSAVEDGLRPDSDLDFLAIAARPLSADERRRLTAGLLPISGQESRPASWRPVELTVVAIGDVRPWRYPPRIQLQYGEWLRDEFLAGVEEPWRNPHPDLAILVTAARERARPLIGPSPSLLLDPVPRADVVRATLGELPSLREDLDRDTRNVLLTLARMWATVTSGTILSKDAAASWALERLPAPHHAVMAMARDLYSGGGYGDWSTALDDAQACADHLMREIRRAVHG